MNSPSKINYETRPFKFTERKMLLSSFIKICSKSNDPYQYIGFGGLAFTDFKLFHKEINIENMNSIEGGDYSLERLLYNSPYSFINIIPEFSTSALTKIDLTLKSLVWLDYDGDLDDYMFEDLSLLMNKLPIGSIYLMTCNRQLKSSESGEIYTIDEFKEKFDSKVPFDLKAKDLSGEENYKTIRKMLLIHIENIIKGRNRTDENIKFQQLYNIIYEENRGARMFTFGGVILERDTDLLDVGLDHFKFISTNEISYSIKIPNLTNKEFQLIDKNITKDSKELETRKILSVSEIDQYKQIYKYVPHFYDIRI